MNREKVLASIWKATHRDYKGTLPDGRRAILILDDRRGTIPTPLEALTDDQIARLIPRTAA